jgi:drug/metabolite transporter (DMT)-like permease
MPKIGASLSAILLTLELPAVVFCAHLILGEQLTFLQIIGITIMLGAIIWLNLVKAKREEEIVKKLAL